MTIFSLTLRLELITGRDIVQIYVEKSVGRYW